MTTRERFSHRLAVALLVVVAMQPRLVRARDAADAQAPETLTLRAAVAEALRHAPELHAPRDAVRSAEIGEQRATAQFGLKIAPSFGSGTDPVGFTRNSAGVSVSKRLRSGADVSVSGDWYRYGTAGGEAADAGYAFSIAQPLLRGFGMAAGADLAAARRAIATSERGLVQARQDLIVRTEQAYFEVVRQSHLADTSRRARARADRLRAVSEARSRVGLATQLDVLRADLLAAQAESGLASVEEAVETAKDRLKALLGRPFDSSIDVNGDELRTQDRDQTATAATPATPRLDDLVAQALASRIEIQEARDRVGDARRSAAIARWNLLPPVTLNLSYTHRGLGGSILEPYQRLWNGWRGGISTAYALDRASEGAAAAQAQIAVAAAERAVTETERQVISDVRAAYRAQARASGNIAIELRAIALSEQQLRLAELRFERGLEGNVDVIDAETNLLQAQSALVAARIDRALSRLILERAAGALHPDEYLR